MKAQKNTDRILDRCEDLLNSNPALAGKLLIKTKDNSEKQNSRFAARLNYIYGKYYNILGEFDKSLEHLKSSLENCRNGDIELKGRINSYIGNVYYKMFRPDEAIKHLLAALKIQEEFDLKNDLTATYLRIGNFYLSFSDNIKNAEKFYKKALNNSLITKNKKNELQSRGGLSSVYHEMNRPEKALETLNVCLQLAEEIKDINAEANLKFEIAKACTSLKDYNKAFSNFKESCEIYKKLKNNNETFSTLMNMAVCCINLGRKTEAERIMEKSESMLKKVTDKKIVYTFHLHFSEIYNSSKKFDKAYEYFRKYHEYFIEALKEMNAKEVSSMKAVFEKEQSEREAEILRLKVAELQNELQAKSRELSLSANYLLSKNEFVDFFGNEIRKFLNSPDFSPLQRHRLKELIRLIEEKRRHNKDFETFESSLSNLNLKLTEKLSRKFPELSKTELRLCTLMKINLSTSEISRLLSLSIRTVENHRHHIIKKLGLPKGQSLVKFINKI